MTPEQRFGRWVRLALAAFFLIFVYVVWMDLYAPLTTLARAQRYVVQLAPQVDGQVMEVAVADGDRVERGDVLFRVDDRDYRLARDAAELAVTGAGQDNTVMLAELAGARARVTGARATLEEARRKQRRLDNLHRSGAVSRQQWEEVQVAVEQARADLEAARAETKRLSTRLGDGDQDNLALARAMNQLETARLQLRRTEVKAPLAGVVTDRQLQVGHYARAREPVLSLVSDEPAWVAADFREKSLRHTRDGDRAEVVFDALPGRVFEARVGTRGWGVRQGQGTPDGALAQVEDSDRWVRDAQRARVRLVLLDPPPQRALMVGARATVQLYPEHGVAAAVARVFGWAQIRALAVLHYLY